MMKDALKKGTLIHEETPFIQVLSSKLRSERCDHCYEKTNLQKCGGCRYVSYCDRACQSAAWLEHKSECSCLKRLPPHRELPNAARILSKIIFKFKRGGDMEKGWYSKSKFRLFKDLMSHYSDIKEDKKRLDHIISLTGVLYDYLGEDLCPNGAEIIGLYGRMIINSFNILDNEMNEIGTGIYLGASTIDHSCRPNAIAIFKGTTIYIRTIMDIPDFTWDKLRISYIDLLKERSERQADLQKQYFFICDCMRCSDDREAELEGAILCQNPHCTAPLPSQTSQDSERHCSECNEGLSDLVVKKYSEVLEFTKEQHSNMKDIAYLDVCRMCLSKQDGLFHSMNIVKVKTLDLAFESAIKLALWNDAVEIGEVLSPAYRRYLGEVHPLLGIHHLRLGKIYLFVDRVKKALEELTKSDYILRLTHGVGHPLYTQELISLLLQAKYLAPPD